MQLKILCGLPILVLLALSGCQKSSDDDTPSVKYKIGQGYVLSSQGKEAVSVNLTEFNSGDRLVLMPFALGNTSSIDGTNASTFSITWTTNQKVKVQNLASTLPSSEGEAMLSASDEMSSNLPSNMDKDHFWRMFWNRFDPIENPEKTAALTHSFTSNLMKQSNTQMFAHSNDIAARLAKHQHALLNLPHQSFTSTMSGGCPSEFYVPGSSKVDDSSTYESYSLPSSEISSYYDGTDHCIVFMSDPVSESSIANVKTSVRTILDRYKNVIYKDSFADAGTYTFKPLIVVVDFSGPQWPSASSNKELQIAGAFFKGLSTYMKRPALYIAADLTKVTPAFPAASAQALFHSTIAHEMQHAIMDYFKNRKGGVGSETLAIDEGYAHLMEDVFGFGSDNFDSYAKPYLTVVPDGIEGALKASSSGALPNVSRGAAQTFLYYLAGRQGGFTFTDGVISESDGLAYIRSAVTAKSLGVANLSARLDLSKAGAKNWFEVVGGYFCSLLVDGVEGIQEYSTGFNAADPQSNITDLIGNKNKTFGLQFNNYRGIKESQSQLKESSSTDFKDGVEVSYYQTQPILHSVQETQSSIVFEIPETTNSGIAVVRIP